MISFNVHHATHTLPGKSIDGFCVNKLGNITKLELTATNLKTYRRQAGNNYYKLSISLNHLQSSQFPTLNMCGKVNGENSV